MKFEAHPPEHSSSIRKIDVIVLTDNRDQSNSDRLFYDYRCSAFKGIYLSMQKLILILLKNM